MKRFLTGSVQSVLVLILVIFLACPTSTFAKAKTKDYVIGQALKLKSKVLNEERPLLISLPDGYEESTLHYPVLYVTDGKGHFHYVTGVVKYLAQQGRMPQLIVVGIPNTNRNHDFTPTKTEKRPEGGGADTFVTFLKKELIPHIENSYRTQPYRIFFGHSLCGMFAIYTALNHSDLFNASISVSPWVIYDNGYILENARNMLKQKSELKKFLYITVGNEPEIQPGLEDLDELFRRESPDGFEWKVDTFKNEDHSTIPVVSLHHGLRALYKSWQLPKKAYKDGLPAIEKHYQSLSEKFGYRINVPEFVLNFLGYKFMGDKKFDEAINVLKMNVEKYSDSANVYDSLGEAYEKNNELMLALKNYKIACKKGKETKAHFLNVYEQNYKRVKDKLNGKK